MEWYIVIGNTFQVFGVWSILFLRIHALYQSKSLRNILIILCMLAGSAMLVIIMFTGLQTPVINEPFTDIYFCSAARTYYRRKGVGLIWAWWVPVLAVESTFFILALLQMAWNFQIMRKKSLLFKRPKLFIDLVIRDFIWYFASIVIIDIASLYIVMHPTGHVIGGSRWTNALNVPFFTFVSSRMSLDILELNRKIMDGKRSGSTARDMLSSQSISDLQFAVRPDAMVDSENEATRVSKEI